MDNSLSLMERPLQVDESILTRLKSLAADETLALVLHLRSPGQDFRQSSEVALGEIDTLADVLREPAHDMHTDVPRGTIHLRSGYNLAAALVQEDQLFWKIEFDEDRRH